MKQWRIQLLGSLALIGEEQTISHFPTQSVAILLAYLATHPNQNHSREYLTELLWQEVEPSAGRNRFKQTLASLRRLLEGEDATSSLLEADRKYVCLQTSNLALDTSEFLSALEQASKTTNREEKVSLLNCAIALYNGDFLLGYYEDWVLQERQRLQDAYAHALTERIALATEKKAWYQAMEDAHHLIALDPLNEEFFGVLMRLYLEMGRHTEALRHYQAFAHRFEAALGIPLSSDLQHLAEQLHRPAPPLNPPLASPVLSNVTAPPTNLLGREAELADLKNLLCTSHPPSRLVSLLGAGGMGKTHLAQEFAFQNKNAFSKGVWFVALADVLHPTRIADTLLQTFSIRPLTGYEPLEQFIEFMQIPSYDPKTEEPRLLLILDNFEHLVEAGTEVLLTLLERIPHLHCLVTSRTALQLRGEYEFSLQPLPLPNQNTLAECLPTVPSIQLFVQRAQSRHQSFTLSTKNATALIGICQQLDGIPLAIELAAAWVRVLTPAQILTHLHQGIELLSTTHSDMPARQRSLYATQEWSIQLLSPEIQQFFFQLSIFRGGWTLEAAQYVCNSPRALQILDALCSASLIFTEEREEGMRYRMLEPVRQYALQKLEESGGYANTAQRHFEYFLEIASQKRHLAVLPEHQNALAALLWSFTQTQNKEACYSLYFEMTYFWGGRGYWHEEVEFFERLQKEIMPYLSTRQRAEALTSHCRLEVRQGHWKDVRDKLKELMQIWESLDDEESLAYTILQLSYTYKVAGDFETAYNLSIRPLQIYEQCTSDRGRLAGVYYDMAGAKLALGCPDEAWELAQKSLEIYSSVDHLGGIALCKGTMGEICSHKGNYQQAHTLLEESVHLFREHQEIPRVAEMQVRLSNVAFLSNDTPQAHHILSECIPILHSLGARIHLIGALQCMIRISITTQNYRHAALVYGVMEALQKSIQLPEGDTALLEALQQRMDIQSLQSAKEVGYRCPYPQIISLIFPRDLAP